VKDAMQIMECIYLDKMTNTKKEIDYKREIMLDFEKQYLERWSSYKKFFENEFGIIVPEKVLTKSIMTYCNMVEDFDFLVALIIKLEDIKK